MQLPQIYEFAKGGTNSQNINESEEILKFGLIIRDGSSSVIVDIQWTYTLNPSSPVIEHIIAVNRVLGRTQIAQMFTYCLQLLDIRLNYYFTLNEQRTELHNNKS